MLWIHVFYSYIYYPTWHSIECLETGLPITTVAVIMLLLWFYTKKSLESQAHLYICQLPFENKLALIYQNELIYLETSCVFTKFIILLWFEIMLDTLVWCRNIYGNFPLKLSKTVLLYYLVAVYWLIIGGSMVITWIPGIQFRISQNKIILHIYHITFTFW